jgi:hypothetical protein
MIKLKLPDDFEDYAWEVEAKGVFWDAHALVEDRDVPVVFYDRRRLAQDVEDDIREQHFAAIAHLIVIDRLTIEQMTDAMNQIDSSFFS